MIDRIHMLFNPIYRKELIFYFTLIEIPFCDKNDNKVQKFVNLLAIN